MVLVGSLDHGIGRGRYLYYGFVPLSGCRMYDLRVRCLALVDCECLTHAATKFE